MKISAADAKYATEHVDELLETIAELRRDPSSMYHKGPLSRRWKEGELALLELKNREREASDLPAPPTNAEWRLNEIWFERQYDWDAHMKNEDVRAEERELLDIVRAEQQGAQDDPGAGVDLGEPHQDATVVSQTTGERRLAKIRDIRRKNYDWFMGNETMRAEELQLLKQVAGEPAPAKSPSTMGMREYATFNQGRNRNERRLSEIAEVRKADYDAYMKDDNVLKEERELLDAQQT